MQRIWNLSWKNGVNFRLMEEISLLDFKELLYIIASKVSNSYWKSSFNQEESILNQGIFVLSYGDHNEIKYVLMVQETGNLLLKTIGPIDSIKTTNEQTDYLIPIYNLIIAQQEFKKITWLQDDVQPN